jgi:quinol monooxygenase YgiN
LLLNDKSKLVICPIVGRPFAITVFMILVITRMKAIPEKRMELSQTIASLSGCMKMEKGYVRCDFCQSITEENRLFLLEEWNTEEELIIHLKSDNFKVLRGAMNMLDEPYERAFHTVFPT